MSDSNNLTLSDDEIEEMIKEILSGRGCTRTDEELCSKEKECTGSCSTQKECCRQNKSNYRENTCWRCGQPTRMVNTGFSSGNTRVCANKDCHEYNK